MARIRVLGATLAVALAAGVLAAASPAAIPIPRPVSTQSATTTNCVIRYCADPWTSDYSAETQAGELAAYAARSYAVETGWGMPVPLDDGDGDIDIYLVDMSGFPGVIGHAEPDGAA